MQFAANCKVLFWSSMLTLILVSAKVWADRQVEVVGLFKDSAVVRIDGKQRVLKVGAPAHEGVRLLSANSNQAVLLVDGKTKRYNLSNRIGGVFTPAPHNIVRVWPDNHGVYATIGSINGSQVDLMIDTGANLVAMNANEAASLGINYRADGKPMMASTANGRVRAFLVMLDEVSVGAIHLRNVEGAVIVGNYPKQVLLGLSFLNRITLSKDGSAMVLNQIQ